MNDVIYLPVPRKLYDDVVRISDGRCDLIDIAIDQFHDFIRRTAEDNAHGLMGDRLEEFLAIYHPDILARWQIQHAAEAEEEFDPIERFAPLVWKDVVIPWGSEVRMQYAGAYHIARIGRGKIVDKDGEFSPSEWASKIAGGTSRNAWRDLYFRSPSKPDWVSATALRDIHRREAQNYAGKSVDASMEEIWHAQD